MAVGIIFVYALLHAAASQTIIDSKHLATRLTHRNPPSALWPLKTLHFAYNAKKEKVVVHNVAGQARCSSTSSCRSPTQAIGYHTLALFSLLFGLLGLLGKAMRQRYNLLTSQTPPFSSPVPLTMQVDVAMLSISGQKVTILGAAGGIGQPLSLLLKDCDMIRTLALYDLAPITSGLAVDLSHCNTSTHVTGYNGADQLSVALAGSDVVIITAGLPRKPGMTRDDLFTTNASIMQSLVQACATHCPQAILLIVANPVNSLAPVAAEVMLKAGVYDARKIIGVTSLDVTRANTWVAELLHRDPRTENVTVIGGHAGTTILPLLSRVKGAKFTEEQIKSLTKRIQFGGDEVVKAKEGNGSATLSMAYSGANFVKRLLQAMNGQKGILECCYTRNCLTPATFFAAPTLLGPSGAEEIMPLGELSNFEAKALAEMLPDLQAQIQKGLDFVQTQ